MTVFSDDYYQSYKNFVQAIEDGPKDLQLIYDHLDELVKDYPQILELSAIELFHDLYAVSPLAAVALFGHSGTRAHYVMGEMDRKCFQKIELNYIGFNFNSFSENKSPFKRVSSDFCKKLGVASQMSHFMCSSSFPEELGEDNYKTLKLADYKDEGWTNVEYKGREFIILKCDDIYGTEIRSVYSKKGLELNEIGLGDIFDGFDIDVKSSFSDKVLVYMEAR